jgi:group I intron endonuclease
MEQDIDKTGVYKIVNKVNGRVYYGSAQESFNKRWSKHQRELLGNIHHCYHLQDDYDIYGPSVFDYFIILECDVRDCLMYEQMYIDAYWDGGDRCYNIAMDATSPMKGRTYQHTEEAKKAIGNNNKGKKRTPEVKERIRQSKLGTKASVETKAKLSAIRMGAGNGFYGKHHTDETIAKIIKTLKGKLDGPKNPMYGKTHTKEARMKISLAATGRQCGEDSPSAKLNWVKVNEIRGKYKTGEYSQRDLAQYYEVCCSTIEKIVNYKIWQIEDNPVYQPGANQASKLTWVQVGEIRVKYETGNYTHKQLSIEYNVKSPTTIMNIINYLTWKPK